MLRNGNRKLLMNRDKGLLCIFLSIQVASCCYGRLQSANVIIQTIEKTLNNNQTAKQKLTNLVSTTSGNTQESRTLLSKTKKKSTKIVVRLSTFSQNRIHVISCLLAGCRSNFIKLILYVDYTYMYNLFCQYFKILFSCHLQGKKLSRK